MESFSGIGRVTFGVLQARLLTYVHARIQNGDFTERGLARILSISQPQMHNILKGARTLRPVIADRILVRMEISLVDLLRPEELHPSGAGAARDAGRRASTAISPAVSTSGEVVRMRKPPAREHPAFTLPKDLAG